MSKTPTAVLFHNLINRGGLHFEEPAGRAPQRLQRRRANAPMSGVFDGDEEHL